MTGIRYRSRPALRGIVAGVGVLGGGLLAASAGAQDRLAVDVGLSGGVSTNPYQRSGSTPAAADATLDLHPSWVMDRPLTTLRVEGDAQVTVYSRDYSANESVNIQGSGSHRASEVTTITGQLSYINSIVGAFTGARVPVGGPVIDNQLPAYLADPSLGGFGRRRQIVQADGGISIALSARDEVGAGVSASINRYSGLPASDFNVVAPRLSYSRAIGERFSVGASLSGSIIQYPNSSTGDATIYSPALTLSRGITDELTLNASAGASIVEFRGIRGGGTSTSFSGSLGLCKRNSRMNACLGASRQASPSVAQDVRFQTEISGSLGYRLSARSDLSATASYSHTGSSLGPSGQTAFSNNDVDYVTVNATYSRRLRQNVSGFLSAGYAKAFDQVVGRDANLTARAGVNIRFGANQ